MLNTIYKTSTIVFKWEVHDKEEYTGSGSVCTCMDIIFTVTVHIRQETNVHIQEVVL